MTARIVITSKNREFQRKIDKLSGQVCTVCDQCGTCTGSCPMAFEMDTTPSNMIRMVQLGQEEVLDKKTLWICASCYTCTVRCPRGLDPSKIAEALRQVKLRQAIDHIDIHKIPKNEIDILPQIALVAAFRKFTG